MSLSVTCNHYFAGLSDELAGLQFSDKDGPVDVATECRIKLVSRGSLSSPHDDGRDELFTCRNRLLWSSKARERMRVETTKEIVDVELCSMVEDLDGEPLLCVAEPALLSIYSVEGDIHQHTVPSVVKRLWSSPAGLVVEGGAGKAVHIILNSINGLEKIKTLTSTDKRVSNDAWEDQIIHFVSTDTPCAVTANESATEYKVWCLKAFPEGSIIDQHAEPMEARNALPYNTATPPTTSSTTSRIRTPKDHIQPFIFSPFRSGTFPGTGSTIANERVCSHCPMTMRKSMLYFDEPDSLSGISLSSMSQVHLPTVGVQLAFDLVRVKSVSDGQLAQVCFLHDIDQSGMLAMLTSTGQVSFYSIEAKTGQVLPRPEKLSSIVSMESLELPDAHLIGKF
jgi:hypothetical protein